ncbi:hypothetical protein F1559_004002 [Cyanidiococcus yangmingshanensis]|uniref:Uncharacterized protein n=1 Tax=Cyanidiococcus yangmingshanensis TaxID=2690220 RepID=A0A7J7IRF6_9RHOD|nr:hypothetical protein F1559_004002 [Cyanidiococcus yangmingshanensis]
MNVCRVSVWQIWFSARARNLNTFLFDEGAVSFQLGAQGRYVFMNDQVESGLKTVFDEYLEQLEQVACAGAAAEQRVPSTADVPGGSAHSLPLGDRTAQPETKGAPLVTEETGLGETGRESSPWTANSTTLRSGSSTRQTNGTVEEAGAVLAELLQRLRAWTEQARFDSPGGSTSAHPPRMFAQQTETRWTEGAASSAEADEKAGTVVAGVKTTSSEPETLSMQLASVQRQAALVHKECAWVQRLCDELSEEVEQQRQRRLLAEERARQLSEQLEDLYEESMKQARSLRLQFEDALEHEREKARVLAEELDELRQQLAASSTPEESEDADPVRAVRGTRPNPPVHSSDARPTPDVFDKMCQTDRVSATETIVTATESIRDQGRQKRPEMDLPIAGDHRVATMAQPKPVDENALVDCQNPGHAQLYVELYEALKQRDLWMREARALAKSLRFFRQAFHY